MAPTARPALAVALFPLLPALPPLLVRTPCSSLHSRASLTLAGPSASWRRGIQLYSKAVRRTCVHLGLCCFHLILDSSAGPVVLLAAMSLGSGCGPAICSTCIKPHHRGLSVVTRPHSSCLGGVSIWQPWAPQTPEPELRVPHLVLGPCQPQFLRAWLSRASTPHPRMPLCRAPPADAVGRVGLSLGGP